VKVTESTQRITALAHGVLLPAIDDLEPSSVRELVRRGSRSVLLGETRAEYLARTMGDERRSRETPELVRALVRDLQRSASGPLIVAVDEELVGIRRFDHLLAGSTPPHPTSSPPEVVTLAAGERAAELAALGVNTVLGPILDVVRGANPWLHGRNLGPDPVPVARLGAAMIEGLRARGVSAICKHYPGHAVVEDDPAVARARVHTSLPDLETIDAAPFRAAVAAGVRGIMLGPAVVESLDPHAPASLSPAVMRHARDKLGFDGALITDDLDATSILRDREIGAVAVAAIAAGADLVLVAAAHADECAAALAQAVVSGDLDVERLSEAAGRTERLAAASSQLAGD
jgi:beta-N-acetylhexosaminidase